MPVLRVTDSQVVNGDTTGDTHRLQGGWGEGSDGKLTLGDASSSTQRRG